MNAIDDEITQLEHRIRDYKDPNVGLDTPGFDLQKAETRLAQLKSEKAAT
jgi:hypothetical protein